MANPSPQHNPTDGLGTPVKLLVSSNDANFETLVANRVYAQQLSVSGATINGVAYSATATLSTLKKDIGNSTFSAATSPYTNVPHYNVDNTYNALSCHLTTGALDASGATPGQVIVEVSYPAFDMQKGTAADDALVNGKIFAQVIVTIYP